VNQFFGLFPQRCIFMHLTLEQRICFAAFGHLWSCNDDCNAAKLCEQRHSPSAQISASLGGPKATPGRGPGPAPPAPFGPLGRQRGPKAVPRGVAAPLAGDSYDGEADTAKKVPPAVIPPRKTFGPLFILSVIQSLQSVSPALSLSCFFYLYL
jgi:hypothetical protein